MALEELHQFYRLSCSEFFSSFEFFENEGILSEAILDYCNDPNETTAEDVYNAYLNTYRLLGLEEIITQMHRFEVLSSQLIARHRDHYIHTINVFLLGISIFQRNSLLRQAISSKVEYPDRYPMLEEEFLFRWGMSSLFHDVGYPLEISYKTIREFTRMLMDPNLMYEGGGIQAGDDRQAPNDPMAVLNFPNLDDILYINHLHPKPEFTEEYYDKYPQLKDNLSNDSLLLIANTISEIGFDSSSSIHQRIIKFLKKGLENGLIDHGVYSSIIFLKWINQAFSKADWNPAYFYYPIVDSASAIFLHNAYDYIFRIPPYNLPALEVEQIPLAFLLILCDRTQETYRKSYGYKERPIEFKSCELLVTDNEFQLTLFISTDDEGNLAILEASNLEESIRNTISINSVFGNFRIVVAD